MSFKRRVLSALGKDELLDIARGLELDVVARMGGDELRDVVAKSKRSSLTTIVQESLSRDTLKEICAACGIDDTGKEKASLVERILAAGMTANGYKLDPANTRVSTARDGAATIDMRVPELSVAKKSSKPRRKDKITERRRAGVPESEAAIAGTLKAALQQFALAAAGGYSGRDAHLPFTAHLLECFGWKDGVPEGAEIPRRFSIADAGQRVEREVALWWPERRAMMDVAAHDAVLDFAWKDLVRVCLQLDPVPQYVVLTNQRDLQLYDLARDRQAPRLAIRIDDLPKYSEAFPFFTKEWTPGAVPKIVNVEKVSEEVADLVALLYRSVRAEHVQGTASPLVRDFPGSPGRAAPPKGGAEVNARERDVIRFTLQCIKGDVRRGHWPIAQELLHVTALQRREAR